MCEDKAHRARDQQQSLTWNNPHNSIVSHSFLCPPFDQTPRHVHHLSNMKEHLHPQLRKCLFRPATIYVPPCIHLKNKSLGELSANIRVDESEMENHAPPPQSPYPPPSTYNQYSIHDSNLHTICKNWDLTPGTVFQAIPQDLRQNPFPSSWPTHLVAALCRLSELTAGNMSRAHALLHTYFRARARCGVYRGKQRKINAGLKVVDVRDAIRSLEVLQRGQEVEGCGGRSGSERSTPEGWQEGYSRVGMPLAVNSREEFLRKRKWSVRHEVPFDEYEARQETMRKAKVTRLIQEVSEPESSEDGSDGSINGDVKAGTVVEKERKDGLQTRSQSLPTLYPEPPKTPSPINCRRAHSLAHLKVPNPSSPLPSLRQPNTPSPSKDTPELPISTPPVPTNFPPRTPISALLNSLPSPNPLTAIPAKAQTSPPPPPNTNKGETPRLPPVSALLHPTTQWPNQQRSPYPQLLHPRTPQTPFSAFINYPPLPAPAPSAVPGTPFPKPPFPHPPYPGCAPQTPGTGRPDVDREGGCRESHTARVHRLELEEAEAALEVARHRHLVAANRAAVARGVQHGLGMGRCGSGRQMQRPRSG
ncbi:hypothetical protein P280DRAFT_511081 [Massarina eburnea CBS 473.64]|uniref:Uncharacterized protein n=1 Tax=Massarina eburnea CBS 473.64 TaxID=1395130 RepID=A0A6A6RJA9_9PLEO|nr:hypothetical protein P280DRAFT_511081 [Massarina eburnea CBS 473.64]